MRLLCFVGLLVFSMFAAFAAELSARDPTPESIERGQFNQVFVKVILPVSERTPKQEGPVVESWVAVRLKQQKVHECFAVTDWVPVCDELLADDIVDNDVWDGCLDGEHHHCPVGGDIPQRENGRVLVRLSGWSPAGREVNITLPDEPGRRAIAAVKFVADKEGKSVRFEGYPYVAVIIAPPDRNGFTPNVDAE